MHSFDYNNKNIKKKTQRTKHLFLFYLISIDDEKEMKFLHNIVMWLTPGQLYRLNDWSQVVDDPWSDMSIHDVLQEEIDEIEQEEEYMRIRNLIPDDESPYCSITRVCMVMTDTQLRQFHAWCAQFPAHYCYVLFESH
jgi:hypothetical protein